MSTKNLAVFVLVMAFAGGAYAQVCNRPQGTSHILVGRIADCGEYTDIKSIQDAVNRARPGDVIEILDTSTYNEQVTIDGRETSPWPGVTGGKNGITIRYVPPGNPRLNGHYARPTIRYQDTENQSPKSKQEAQDVSAKCVPHGDMPGCSGNFEANGALRILRAQGVTIEGIAVDGGGAAPFGAAGVWCPPQGGNCHAIFHGNAAIAVAVAGGAIIRGCDIKNGYFGISVKDRNTGGVFGNPNPADNDNTVPLSGFGRVGNHLFEHNRIHKNSVGIYFESAWDLGSSVRYNLIFDNYHRTTTWTTMATLPDPGDQNGGGMLFKDMYLTPVAIYNNTFYNNNASLFGQWQVGGQHLLFNNIHGKSSRLAPRPDDYADVPHINMAIEHRFPNRMRNSVFSAHTSISPQCQSNFNCNSPNNPLAPGGCYINDVQMHRFSNVAKERVTLTVCSGGTPVPGQTQPVEMARPGTAIAVQTGATFPADAGVRWLQMEGGTFSDQHNPNSGSVSLPPLFKSLVETSPDFLVPDWDHPQVVEFVMNGGWDGIGMVNADGKIADMGAIPSDNRRPAVTARLKPSNVVLITGRSARASVFLDVQGGVMNNPKIRFLRWVAPLPDNTDSWADGLTPVPSGAVVPVPIPTEQLQVGNNQFTFELPTAITPALEYGFFEMVVEGTDAAGNPVVSDVGFLPYRQLEHFLEIEFYPLTGSMTAPNRLTVINAGENVRMRVSALKGTAPFTGTPPRALLDEVAFDLLSDPAARMFCVAGCQPSMVGNPLTSDLNMDVPAYTYTVYFTRAGSETVMGTGVHVVNPNVPIAEQNRLVFLGATDITIRPGPPDQVSFIRPIPNSMLGGAQPTTINRGMDYNVEVQVQDRFGNPVDQAVPVTISTQNVSDNDRLIGDAGNPADISNKVVNTVATGDAAGTAYFIARVANGNPGHIFNLTASITVDGAQKTDVSSLRVGRTLDALTVFYADAEAVPVAYDPDEVIDGKVGDWFKITVRAMLGADSVLVGRNQYVSVTADAGLTLSATEGGAPATVFPLVNGEAVFWVTAGSDIPADINGACVQVVALLSNDPSAVDGSIAQGGRCDIKFIKPSSSIRYAVIYGDGHGVPVSVEIHYERPQLGGSAGFYDPGFDPPDSVSVRWPASAISAATVRGAAITVIDTFVIRADLTGARTAAGDPLPTGYTGVSAGGQGIVAAFGGIAGVMDDAFDVLDGIGPVIADDKDRRDGEGLGNPLIVENPGGAAKDTIYIQFSEDIADMTAFEGPGTLLFSQEVAPNNDPATGGVELDVEVALPILGSPGLRLVLAAGSPPVPVRPGNWIRLNPSSGVRDFISPRQSLPDHPQNAPHANNRWVQLLEKPVPPSIDSAWYTSNVVTGLPDYAYVAFNKAVNPELWFSGGGYLKFDADSTAAPARLIEFASPDSMMIRIDLAGAFPSSQGAVRTSAPMSFRIGFRSTLGWAAMSANAVDRAKPVLVDNVTLKFGGMRDDETLAPDTFIVIYSETMAAGLESVSIPIVIVTGTGLAEYPTLRMVGLPVSVGNFTRITYIAESAIPDYLVTGDSVYIRHDAGVADRVDPEPNVQDQPNNRRVALVIDRGELKWALTIKNNPFRGGGGSDGESVFALSPGREGIKVNLIRGNVRIYDKLGNLVRDEELDPKDQNNINTNNFEWKWNGRNIKGRFVGTGSYLFVATYDAELVIPGRTETERLPRHRERRRVGVVR